MTEEDRSGKKEANQRSDIEIANELITFANDKQEAGIHPTVIAAAFRLKSVVDDNLPIAIDRCRRRKYYSLPYKRNKY